VRNVALLLEYDGTDFSGWQRQRGARTVAGVLEEKLSPLVAHDVRLVGAGRTDSGVHALGQVANFLTESVRPALEIHSALNGTLPPDVGVRAVAEVPAEFHARYSATSRRYRYRISTRRRAVGRGYCWDVLTPLSLGPMRLAASAIVGRWDFGSFCTHSRRESSLLSSVTECQWLEQGSYHLFEIEADRFLHRMVRSLVGTLVQVGCGRMDLREFQELLQNPSRHRAGPTAPARGLTLTMVRYPVGGLFDGKEGEVNEAFS
jgi:tRNA pseudouridine38-40 synthase